MAGSFLGRSFRFRPPVLCAAFSFSVNSVPLNFIVDEIVHWANMNFSNNIGYSESWLQSFRIRIHAFSFIHLRYGVKLNLKRKLIASPASRHVSTYMCMWRECVRSTYSWCFVHIRWGLVGRDSASKINKVVELTCCHVFLSNKSEPFFYASVVFDMRKLHTVRSKPNLQCTLWSSNNRQLRGR